MVLIRIGLQWCLKVPYHVYHGSFLCGTYKENLISTIALYEVPIPHCGTYKKNLISTIALYEVLIPYCGTYKKKLISTTPLYKLS